MTGTRRPPGGTALPRSAPLLSGSRGVRLIDDYDSVLLDLDGVVYVGPHAVPGAPQTIATLRQSDTAVVFVTNNAARTTDEVAAAMTGLGVEAAPADIVTAAQAAARLLCKQVPAGSAVLVVGGAGLRAALKEYDLRPVATVDDEPAAVIQGWSPDLAWPLLAEGCVAVASGLPWVASNTDLTIPTPRGLAPGSGAFVNAIATTTRRRPVVAGKPEPPLLEHAVERAGGAHPIFVGDRLDTDIVGAARAGMDSLLVLTGVTRPLDLLLADAASRPTHLAADIQGLLDPAPAVSVDGGRASCGGWVTSVGPHIEITGSGDPLDALRALCCAVWAAADERQVPTPDLEAALARLELPAP